MATDNPPAWEVTQQVETTDLGPAGVYVSGLRVTFRTASGAIGSVFLPHADVSVERVKAAIEAKAATLDTIAGLTG